MVDGLIIPGNKGELSKVGNGTYEQYTDNNVPLFSGKILVISESDVLIYEKLFNDNPDYFVDNNIVKVRIMKDEDYNTLIMKQYEMLGLAYDNNLCHINEAIEADRIAMEKETIDTELKRREREELQKGLPKNKRG